MYELMKFPDYTQARLDHYENNYKELPFENEIRKYRKKNIESILLKYPHS